MAAGSVCSQLDLAQKCWELLSGIAANQKSATEQIGTV
jgi:hypothetical protein